MSAVLRRLCGRGKTPSQIAEILETTTGEITTALRRLGYHPK
jgi:DNA-binding CsgD family transcriptional regulator